MSDVLLQDATTLEVLAAKIRRGYDAFLGDEDKALSSALLTGTSLLLAQKRVTTGFYKWITKNCTIPLPTAKLFMRLARHQTEIEAERDRVGGKLSLSAAYRLIKKPGTPREPKPILLEAWDRTPRDDRPAELERIPFEAFMAAMPTVWRSRIIERLQKLRATKEDNPSDPTSKFHATMSEILRKAILLVQMTTVPDASEATIDASKAEALACIHHLLSLITDRDIKLDHVTIATPYMHVGSKSKARRRAA